MLEQVISNKTGWTRVAFGDVVRKVNDKVDPWESGLERYVAGDHMTTDDLQIRRWGTIGDDYLGPAFHMRFNIDRTTMTSGDSTLCHQQFKRYRPADDIRGADDDSFLTF